MTYPDNDLSDWQPIATAPRDGTPVILTWMARGEAQEIHPGYVWNRFAGNPLVQDGKGIWALHARDGCLLCTWSEEHPDGAPTHWAPMEAVDRVRRRYEAETAR